MRHVNILYFVFAVFILGFGGTLLFCGEGKTWVNVCILLIGVYFLYRGVAVTVNTRIREERERHDRDNDPANA
jgi:hypothetical protein